jgi:hypothetical protein
MKRGTKKSTDPKTKKNTGIAGVRKSYPNKTVDRVKGTTNKYTLTSSNGSSVTLTRGVDKNPTKKYTTKKAVAKTLNKKKKK